MARPGGTGVVLAVPLLVVGGLLAAILLFARARRPPARPPRPSTRRRARRPIVSFSGEQLRDGGDHERRGRSACSGRADHRVMTAMGESSCRASATATKPARQPRPASSARAGKPRDRMDPTASARPVLPGAHSRRRRGGLRRRSQPTASRTRTPSATRATTLPPRVVGALVSDSDRLPGGCLVCPSRTRPDVSMTSGFGYRGFVSSAPAPGTAVDLQHTPDRAGTRSRDHGGDRHHAVNYQISIKGRGPTPSPT